MPPPTQIAPGLGRGQASGTCGELVQGVLPGGRSFHVTCPIALGARVAVRLSHARALTITGLPPHASAAAAALRLTAAALDLGPVAIHATLASELPTAKGMASSTADVVAAARALASAAGRALAPSELASIATAIEPSDGVMHDGVVAVDQRDGTLLRDWDWMPELTVAAFVPRASRRTASTDLSGHARLAPRYAELLARVDLAMTRRDAAALAASATCSAELNEALVPNPLRAILASSLRATGALGLCVGHSGTVCGLLFDGDAPEQAAEAVRLVLPALPPGTRPLLTRTAP